MSSQEGWGSRLRASTFLFAVLLFLFALPANGLTVGEILGAPDRFDDKEVVLAGRAEAVRPRVSHRGNEYTTFTLSDQSGQITVFSWGKLPVTGDVKVRKSGEVRRACS
jgi:hypothetical protein